MVAETTKNWGDEDEEFLPCRTETTPDAEGIRTVVEYAFNAQGQKVRTTRRIQHTTKVIRTSKRILERRHWEKFGKALSEKSNTNVTYIADADITIEDPNSDMVQPGEKKEEESIFAGVKNSSIVACRHCGMVGDHWTLKCPYKDTPADEIPDQPPSSSLTADTGGGASGGGSSMESSFAALRKTGGGKYVPPSQRAGATTSSGSGSGFGNNGEEDRDHATLRVTNISSDTRDSDLQELFRPFGPIARIYLAKDRETFESRGFAFISFHMREDAERAKAALDGHGYDHLILKLEWAKPSTKPSSDKDGGNPGSMGTTFRSGYGKALPQGLGPSKK